VAKYFNRVGFKPGPYSRRLNGKWDGKMVRRFYGNPLLAGKPGRGYRHTIKHHERGKRISVPNADGPDFFDAPHLAHLDYDEFLELNELLRQKNSKLGRKKVNGIDPRMRVPRKTTVYPSQHARCLYCGFHHVRGANGLKDNIYCSNARANGCWASCSVNCNIAAIKTMDAITSMLYDLDSFDAHFRELVDRAHVEREEASAEKWNVIEAEETRIGYELTHLIQSLKEFGPSPEIKAEHDELQRRKQQLGIERRALSNPSATWVPLPHHNLLEQVETTLQSSGLSVVNEAHALWHDGLRYFGLLEVANGKPDEDYSLVVGLRNSHDHSFSASIAMGSAVTVCDNLAFSGEVAIARRHTRFIRRDLPRVVHTAVGRLADMRVQQHERITAYKQMQISDSLAHDLVIRAIDASVLPVTQVPAVLSEWRTPAHEEFVADGKTAWRLFNAFTETWKGRNLAALPSRSLALHGLIDGVCGLAV
jgi:hypothetical protein